MIRSDPGARLAGRVCIITGGPGEPGAGIGRRFAREGATVVFIDENDQGAVTSAIDRVVRIHGRLDILVNAAGPVGPPAAFVDKTDADFRTALDRCLFTALWAMQAALPHLRERGGRIINLGSVYGDNVHRFIADYDAATEALKGLTRSAAAEWGRYDILVNLLVATVDDDAWRKHAERHADEVAPLLALVPLQRMGDPEEDVGGAALFLASDLGSYVNGHVIHADGGYHMAGPAYMPAP